MPRRKRTDRPECEENPRLWRKRMQAERELLKWLEAQQRRMRAIAFMAEWEPEFKRLEGRPPTPDEVARVERELGLPPSERTRSVRVCPTCGAVR